MKITTVGATLVAIVAIVSLAAGCGWGKTACSVVDTAEQGCTVLRYLEKDGTPREVRVTKEEMQDFGAQVSARRAAARSDGGAP